jgi:hypothetical protein
MRKKESIEHLFTVTEAREAAAERLIHRHSFDRGKLLTAKVYSNLVGTLIIGKGSFYR